MLRAKPTAWKTQVPCKLSIKPYIRVNLCQEEIISILPGEIQLCSDIQRTAQERVHLPKERANLAVLFDKVLQGAPVPSVGYDLT